MKLARRVADQVKVYWDEPHEAPLPSDETENGSRSGS